MLFEEFFARIARLVIPAFAFLTFYSLLIILFASAYRILSAYTGEYDHFDDTACDEDMRRMDRLVRKLRCPDPASVLRCMFQDLLKDLPLNEYASLVGKTFRVSLGESADEAAVDLVS